MGRGLMVAFVAGIGFGAAAVLWVLGRPAAPPALQQNVPSRSESASFDTSAPSAFPRAAVHGNRGYEGKRSARAAGDGRQAVAAIQVLDARYEELGRQQTPWVSRDRMLVLPIPWLRGAHSVSFMDSGGEQTVVEALAYDLDAGLLAIAGGEGGPHLELDEQDYPLFLGREVWLVTARARTDAWVSAPQTEMPNSPIPVTPLGLQGRPTDEGGALVDPQGRSLLGIVLGRLDGERLAAVEVKVLRDLLGTVSTQAPRPIADIAREYFSSTSAGRWQEIQHRMAEGRWQEVIELAEPLLDSDWRYREPMGPVLEQALTELVNAYRLEGSYDQALSWLDRGRRLLGESAALYMLYANTHTARRDFAKARSFLRQAARLDPSLTDAANRRLRGVVLAEVRIHERDGAVEQILALLEEASREDPDYAAYHQHLGRYYLQVGDYPAAIGALERAMVLDASLRDAAMPLLREARLRLSLPELTRVSFLRAHGVIYVDVRLNDAPWASRFILDTGASYTVISRELADVLGIQLSEAAPRVRVQTANNTVLAPLVTLTSVDLGGARVQDVPALVLDTLGGTDGLLGLSYLRFFDVAIEQDDDTLSLHRK